MLIQVNDVYYSYLCGEIALNGVNLTIQPGEMVALVGENGSGKTTLARHLNGLLQPQKGTVWIGDWQTSNCSPAKMARRVAYVFQNPDEQLFCQTIRDEIAFGPLNLGYTQTQTRTLVDWVLEWVNLKDKAEINPRNLGYTGRKWVALASGLAMDTPILVLDEPTAGLDSGELDQLSALIRALKDLGKTILFISHNMDFVGENMDRIILMREGRVELDAPVEQFFKDEGIQNNTGILSPQLVRLSERLRHKQLAVTDEQFIDNLRYG